MGKMTFIIGGARSGKSRYAFTLAKKEGGRVAFIATCQPKDKEMKRRIALHKNSRPASWETFEEPYDISKLLKEKGAKFEIIIIDCLTLLVSNLMLKGSNEKDIENKVRDILKTLKKIKAESIIVSNEVGLGIVPPNKLARDFRDIAGRINQMVAAQSDKMYFMVSGIPWRIK